MKVKHFFLLIFLQSLSIAAAAQTRDTIIIPKIKYDPKRALDNERIDELQLKADRWDGLEDGKIIVGFDQGISQHVSSTLLQMIDVLQVEVENSKRLELYEKSKYTNRIKSLLQLWFTDALDGYFVFKYYDDALMNLNEMFKYTGDVNMLEYAKRHPKATLTNIGCFASQKDMYDFLKFYALVEPHAILIQSKELFKEKYFDSLVTHIAKLAPTAVLKYYYTKDPIADALKKSNDTIVKKLLHMYTILGTTSKAYPLLHDVVIGKYTYYEADSVASNEYRLFKALIKIRSSSGPVGEYSVDEKLNELALIYVREVNAQYELHDADKRFAKMKTFNAQELYTLIVYTEDEIFTSTFNGIFKIFLTKLKPLNGRELLYTVNDNRMRVFIKLCAGFDVFDQFLATMDNYSKDELLYQFVQNLENAKTPLEDIVHVADTFGSVKDAKLAVTFSRHIERQLEKMIETNNAKGIEIYGILKDLNCTKGEVFDIKCMERFVDKYKIQPVSVMRYASLIDADSVINEQFFFYDDDDGEASYASFLSTYRTADWKLEDRGNWVKIASTKGKKVHIYANKTKVDRQGQLEISEYLQARNTASVLAVHRGHSFYTPKTIEQIPYNTKIVIMGSCGGYHTLTNIIDKSPFAQIVSSKQTGTMSVNDPMMRLVNEQLRLGKDIVWDQLWLSLDKQLKSTGETYNRFKDYVPPHKNLGALFIMAYNNAKLNKAS